MLNVLGPIRILTLSLAACVCASLAPAQTDWHFGAEGNKTLFERSTFAHGYMHGYEEGFHKGDLDLQMGRSFHEVKEQERYRKIYGYRSEYGDHATFENGYRKGYAVGYTDSYSGRSFRAAQLVSRGRSDATAPSPVGYDRGFTLGYEAGQKIGLQDGRSSAAAAAVDSIPCPEQINCDAFRGGYRLGYSDGFANQKGSREVFARK